MFTKENNDISKYVKDPFKTMTDNHDDEYESTCKEYKIFGKQISMTVDPIIHHIHLKVNDACNGNCPFCIESGRCLVEENDDLYLKRLDEIFKEFEKEDLIYSVSITGGEPFLSKKIFKIMDIIDKYDFQMVTINTNATFLEQNVLELAKHKLYGINISRHHYDEVKNNEIFGFKNIFKNDDLLRAVDKLKKIRPDIMIRLQCILVKDYIDSLEEMEKFANYFKNDIDDFSFRQQMTIDDSFDPRIIKFFNETFIPLEPIIKRVYDDPNYEFLYQRIVDYYAYEGWKNKKIGKDFCFSFSNMELLLNSEENEDENLIREFIYYYNGRLSGSWTDNNKTLLEPFTYKNVMPKK